MHFNAVKNHFLDSTFVFLLSVEILAIITIVVVVTNNNTMQIQVLLLSVVVFFFKKLLKMGFFLHF